MTLHVNNPAPATLVALLRGLAETKPQNPAYGFMVDGEHEDEIITYGELDRRARAIAAHLQARRIHGAHAPGERALLLYNPGLEYLAAFFGCLYAGVVAVPAYPPRLKKRSPRIVGIATDAQARFALTTPDILANIEQRFTQSPELAALNWLDTSAIPSLDAGGWQPGPVEPDTIAFLQYTSGSTGRPKGVMLSHGNLMHNLAVITHGFRIHEVSLLHEHPCSVFWLPVYHDMGLIGGILTPMFVEKPSYIMSPASFLQRPARWLQAISRLDGMISGAPNFAYQLCVDKVSPEQCEGLDLSGWDVAFSGAEPVRHSTLLAFAEKFAPYGFREEAFYPCYGLAEGTLIASGGHGAARPTFFTFDKAALMRNVARPAATPDPTSPDNVALVGCGNAILDQRLEIVDPRTRRKCPPGTVGEIWTGGGSVAKGYWQRPEETAAAFQGYLSDTGEGPFLCTGDLGFIHQGQLCITGRVKDLIIIRGRNHYPQDIEETVASSHPALEPDMGAAFSVDIAGEERLVITHELSREQRRSDTDQVIAAIRAAIAEEHELRVYAVLLLAPFSIPRTSSGKIRRYACREGFLEGSLRTIGEWRDDPAASPSQPAPAAADTPSAGPDAANLVDWLVAQVAGLLNTPPQQVDPNQPFTYYGLDSAQAVSVAGDLERKLGRDLPPTLLWDYPTINALSAHLAGPPAVAPEVVQPAVAPTPTRPAVRPVSEPIAIVGLGCRFPGADGPDAYWSLLEHGVDAIREVPADRFDAHPIYDERPAIPGKLNTRWGGFLDGVDRFDPHFFGISPREASRIDPQQRLVLEVAWEALEHAGIAPADLAGSPTGVFLGISGNEYSRLQFEHLDDIDPYAGTGNAYSIAANRLSYTLDLRGPSLAIDTACSSSLVAVHQAMHSLRAGESDLALAGGVNLILFPDVTVYFSQARAMAADGRCKTFDERADGYVRSEGCGMVVLKRLSDARRDGDRVIAVIHGSAVNQDGRSNGLTAPNSLAQQAVIRQALTNAGVSPADIHYLESHGTGTALGDPIEVQSIRAVMEAGREPDQPLFVGSVKTNMGHLEAAAGVAGLMKAALALQHGSIPPNLHFTRWNPYIDMAGSQLQVPTRLLPWPESDRPRLAGVSSFGFGGTNAHLIIGDPLTTAEDNPNSFAPSRENERQSLTAAAGSPDSFAPFASSRENGWQLLPLSAHSPAALRENAARFAAYLAAPPAGVDLADITYTAAIGRNHFPYRLVVAGDSTEQLRQKLARLAARPADGAAPRPRPPKIAFLFGGAGNEYAGMGEGLYENYPVFRAAIDRCDALLSDRLPLSLRAVMYPDRFGLEAAERELAAAQMAYLQPALFALEYALYELWRSWGVSPDLVLGHSTGEYAAACVAGVFSLEDGLRLIAARGRLMDGHVAGGLMAAVFAPRVQVEPYLAHLADDASISAVNAPNNVVISGRADAVRMLTAHLREAGIEVQELPVSRPAHSPLVEPMLEPFAGLLAEVTFRPTTLPLVSAVTGRLVPVGETLDAGYWLRHLRQAVLFQEGILALAEAGADAFIELGPQPSLLAMGRRSLPDSTAAWLPSLRRRRPDPQMMLDGLGELYELGLNPIWRNLATRGRKVALPTSYFERERYWFESKRPPASRPAPAAPTEPRRMATALPLYEWQPPADLPPADAWRELARFVARDLFGPGEHEIDAWLQSDGPAVARSAALQAAVTIQDARRAAVQIYSAAETHESGWRLVAGGQLLAHPAPFLMENGKLRNGNHAKEPLHLPAQAPATMAVQPAPLPPVAAAHIWEAATPEAQLERAAAYLQEAVADVIGASPERVGREQPLDALGLDSLMAIELRGRLERELGVVLPVVSFLEGPTVSDLARRLLEVHASPAEADMPAPQPVVAREGTAHLPHPLSYNQQALWFLHELLPPGLSFNVAGAVRLRGPVDPGAFRRAFAALVDRHSSLRLTFSVVDGVPAQQAHPQPPLPFVEVDASGWSDQTLQDYLVTEAYRPFDLRAGPVIRLLLLRRAEQEHVLLLCMDHIVVDLWSVAVLVTELYQLYREESGGPATSLAPLPLAYADYVYWEQALLESPAGQRMREYWLGQLAGELPLLNLATDRPRPATQSYAGDTTNLILPASLVDRLRELSRAHGATLYMTLLAAFQTLLHRYTGQEDLLVGTVLTNREQPEFAGLLGYLISPLAMRADFRDRPSFADFLTRTRRAVLDAVANQNYPLPMLADRLNFPRDPGRPPIFETMFIMQQAQILDGKHISAFAPGMPQAEMDLAGLTMQSLPLPGMPAQFDLTLMIGDLAEGLGASLHYNSDLFERATADRMLRHFHMLLEGIVADPVQPLAAIPLLPDDERRLLLEEWNATSRPLPAAESLPDLILPVALRQPDRVALVAPDRALTYGQLACESERWAAHLQSLGVRPGALVGVGCARKSYMPVALLAVLRAGGAYVPLDPAFPRERLALMVEDARPVVLLTDRDNLPLFAGLDIPAVVCLDDPLPEHTPAVDQPAPSAEDPAYVIYTSGSTGRPKGVQVPHRAIVNFISSMLAEPGIAADDNLLAVTTISFDIAALELFLPLAAGATITLASAEQAADGAQLAALLASSGATMMQATPAGWQMLFEAGWRGGSHLSRILVGGEALPPRLARDLLDTGAEVWNMYGPTETTVWSTIDRVTDPDDVTIGRPIANTTIYVLDESGRPAPIGAPGDLYIGGRGVATGYLGRPDLTADRFRPDPFAGGVMYRTGDKARYRADGRLVFLGRDDFQVKIRGFRIELGDIEAALAHHPAGRSNVVIVREDQPGDKRLVAYLVTPPGETMPAAADLRDFLREHLPEYMLPAQFVALESLPLTPNGKVDRRSLPAPAFERPDLSRRYVAPRTPQEAELAALLAGVLKLEQVGIHDNFFELGGNSLLATRLIFQVSEQAGVQVPLRYLFAEPTVAGLVKAVNAARRPEALQAGRHESLFGDVSLETLMADARLDPAITAGDLPPANLTDPRRVLLTGVTGFLGAFLLQDLLERTDALVYCLVRAGSPAQAEQRVRDNLARYELWDESYRPRLVFTPGDLSRPRLGLSPAEFAELAGLIDIIHHNGALVNFVYPYQTHKDVNVRGTTEILRLATTTRLKAVHFVSTLSVLHTGGHDDGRVYREDADLPAIGAPFGGYAQSKWVGEELVREAGRRGVPVAVYRPGPVGGHSLTGVTNSDDMMSTIARACMLLGAAPELDVRVEIAPVDFCSAAIVELSLRGDSIGKTFHLANPQRWAYRELVEWVRAQGYPLQLAPYEEWRDRLLALARQLGGDDWGAFLPLLQETESGQIYMPAIDASNTLAGLADTGVRCAPLGPELMGRYLSYFARAGLVPAHFPGN